MSRNNRTSAHYSTPQAARHRPKVGLTLSPEAIERLESVAAATGQSKSAIVDALLMHKIVDDELIANTLEVSPFKLFSTIVK